MVFIKNMTHRDKIILKIYFKYIMKKFVYKNKYNRFKCRNITFGKSFQFNKIYVNHKFFLESILNKKYVDNNYNTEFQKFSIQFHKPVCNVDHNLLEH
jgi:hypothetical protein